MHNCILCMLLTDSDSGCEAGGDLGSIDTDLINIKTTWFTQQKQWGLYKNKVTSSLAAIQRPGHWADNCRMVYWRTDVDDIINLFSFSFLHKNV